MRMGPLAKYIAFRICEHLDRQAVNHPPPTLSDEMTSWEGGPGGVVAERMADRIWGRICAHAKVLAEKEWPESTGRRVMTPLGPKIRLGPLPDVSPGMWVWATLPDEGESTMVEVERASSSALMGVPVPPSVWEPL